MRPVFVAAPLAIAALVAGFFAMQKLDQNAASSTTAGNIRIVDVPLIDGDGQPVHLRDLHKKWLVLFFGYASCPDVCPMSLAYLGRELRDSGDIAEQVQPVFVSVDPQRDSPEVLKRYTQAFDARILGATGTAENLATISKKLGVYYEVTPDSSDASGKNYTIVHSGAFFILRPDGTVVKTLSPPQAPGALSEALRTLAIKGV